MCKRLFLTILDKILFLTILANGVVVFTYKNDYGGPLSCMLGITADTAGYLYVVIFNGGVVLKVNPK